VGRWKTPKANSTRSPKYFLDCWLDGRSGGAVRLGRQDGQADERDDNSMAARIKAGNDATGTNLTIVDEQIYCTLCRTELNCTVKTVMRHVTGSLHKKAFDLKQASLRSQATIEIIHRERVSDKIVLFHTKVAAAALAAGVSFSALKHELWQELLGDRLIFRTPINHTRQLRNQVPAVIKNIKDDQKRHLGHRPVVVLYDLATNVAEVACVKVRVTNEKLGIAEFVVSLTHKNGKLDHEELAAELERAVLPLVGRPRDLPADAPLLARDLMAVSNGQDVNIGNKEHTIMGNMSDSESTNLAAMRDLDRAFPHVRSFGCLSHSLQNVGKRRGFSALAGEFLKIYQEIIRSTTAKALFKNQRASTSSVNATPIRFSKTRWYGEQQQVAEVVEWWPEVRAWLTTLIEADCCKALALKLSTLTHGTSGIKILYELTGHVDLLKCLVRACYLLEGRDVLGPLVYGQIKAIEECLANSGLPARIRTAGMDDMRQSGAISLALASEIELLMVDNLKPMYQYFWSRYLNDVDVPGEPKYQGSAAELRFTNNLAFYRDLNVFNPIDLASDAELLNPNTHRLSVEGKLRRLLADVFFRDVMRAELGLPSGGSMRTNRIIGSLMAEFKDLLVEVAAMPLQKNNEEALGMWWRSLLKAEKVPTWCRIMLRVALVPTSSASVERSFSSLQGKLTSGRARARQVYRFALCTLGSENGASFTQPDSWPSPRHFDDGHVPRRQPQHANAAAPAPAAAGARGARGAAAVAPAARAPAAAAAAAGALAAAGAGAAAGNGDNDDGSSSDSDADDSSAPVGSDVSASDDEASTSDDEYE